MQLASAPTHKRAYTAPKIRDRLCRKTVAIADGGHGLPRPVNALVHGPVLALRHNYPTSHRQHQNEREVEELLLQQVSRHVAVIRWYGVALRLVHFDRLGYAREERVRGLSDCTIYHHEPKGHIENGENTTHLRRRTHVTIPDRLREASAATAHKQPRRRKHHDMVVILMIVPNTGTTRGSGAVTNIP